MKIDVATFDHFKHFHTIDAHTEGEPLRIITGGYPEILGTTILEKRRYLLDNLDQYRQVLMFEPRGHADMYGALITEPVTEGSDFGILFLHNEGYSSMCGHAIIAISKIAVEIGHVKPASFPHNLKIDSPAGLISSWVDKNDDGELTVWFENVASYAHALDCNVEVEGFGIVKYDIGFGGAYYAYVDADAHGISCSQDNVNQLIDMGRRIKHAVMAAHPIEHPRDEDLGFLYGTIFHSAKTTQQTSHSRHVCIFAEGEVDRSPTGTGVAGRIALLHAKGEVSYDEQITIESIVDGQMKVSAKACDDFYQYPAVKPKVHGRAWITGVHQFMLDPTDIFQNGFILR